MILALHYDIVCNKVIIRACIMDSEMLYFLVWSLSSSAWYIMQYTVYPCIVSCHFYAIPIYPFRAKNNVRTTVNFRANDGKDRSNDYTSGHYDRPGEALNRSCDARTARVRRSIDRSIARTYVRTCVHIYIYIYIYTSSMFPGSSLLPRNNFKKGGRSLGTRLRRV